MERVRLVNKKTQRYWEIDDSNGLIMYIRWGKIGTSKPRTIQKFFLIDYSGEVYNEKSIIRKLREGYTVEGIIPDWLKTVAEEHGD